MGTRIAEINDKITSLDDWRGTTLAHVRDLIHAAEPDVVEEVKWQEHPDIWHDEVKLGGEVSVFYPHWANDITIPNGASQDEIKAACQLGLDKYLHPEKYEKKK